MMPHQWRPLAHEQNSIFKSFKQFVLLWTIQVFTSCEVCFNAVLEEMFKWKNDCIQTSCGKIRGLRDGPECFFHYYHIVLTFPYVNYRKYCIVFNWYNRIFEYNKCTFMCNSSYLCKGPSYLDREDNLITTIKLLYNDWLWILHKFQRGINVRRKPICEIVSPC